MKRKREEQPSALTDEPAPPTEEEPKPPKRKRRRDGWDWSDLDVADMECLLGCLMLPLRLVLWVVKAVFEAVTN